jgi:hypothetical protein
MRELKINYQQPPRYVRMLACGLPSSGKTTFAGSAPKPLFISDAAEGGYNALYQMSPDWRWDPKVGPDVWAIEQMADIPIILARLEQLVASGKFPYETLVIDPLSIYVDRVLSELMAHSPGQDARRYYGDLANHLRLILMRFHALPCHVIWLCHVRADGNETNGPAIGGQMGTKMPAYMDFKVLTNVQTSPTTDPIYELRTRPFRSWTFLGSRWPMPDPMIPSFKCIAQVLGLENRPVSPSVPGFPDGVTYPAPGAVPPPPPPPQQP